MNNPNASPSDIAHIITNPDLDTFERNHCHRVTPELVKANPDIGWIPERLAANPNFDLATLYEMYPLVNKEWFRNYYMLNPNVTADDVVNYGGTSKLEKASTVVHWRGISDTVLKTDCWAWDFVIMNPTIFDCEEEIKLAKAALVILKAWRESMSNPRYRLCRQRLMREFAELDPDV
jgi:hypothetical protein